MILLINTAAENKVTIALTSDDGDLILIKNLFCYFDQAEKLLPAIDKIIKNSKANLNNLKGLVVVSGPGGFTALRIGAMTANTLAFALKIPLTGVKLSEFVSLNELAMIGLKRLKKVKTQSMVMPYYGRQPHITKPKKKIWS
jgi:tRNA threonylcarbamoyladenosine biosynthesis protein TsaB